MINKEHFEDWFNDNKINLQDEFIELFEKEFNECNECYNKNEFIELFEKEFDEYCEKEYIDSLERFI